MSLFLNAVRANLIEGDLITTGYITGKKQGVSAYLTASAATTVATAGTYTPILGTFSNSPFEDFTIAADKITYTGRKNLYFEIDWHASVAMASANRTATATIKHNTTILTTLAMSALCKTAGEAYPFSGSAVVLLSAGDTIQLVCTASNNTSVITFLSFLTTIRRFFQ